MGHAMAGPGILFTIVPIFIGLCFLFVFGMIAFTVFRGLAEWHKNNQLPQVDREVVVLGKREETHRRMRHHGVGNHRHHGSSTYSSYSVTFEAEDNGDRLHFTVNSGTFDSLFEGDRGILRHQGTRFLGFERDLSAERTPPSSGTDYACDHCGAALGDGADVSPRGDVKCEYCNKWFNIHSPA